MSKSLCRQELYELVWSTPMKTLAAQFGISDVGLKKTCARASIPTPDRGYWAKRDAGKATTKIALPKRAPGMSDEFPIAQGSNYGTGSWREDEILGPLPPPPTFSETIESLRKRIAEVVGEVTVPKKVSNWHPVIGKLLQEDERRREEQRFKTYSSPWDAPRFDSPLEQRRLRILNSLFFAVAKMNGKPNIDRSEPKHTAVQISWSRMREALSLLSQARW